MCQKLWKLAGSRQSYCKNYLAYFFLAHPVKVFDIDIDTDIDNVICVAWRAIEDRDKRKVLVYFTVNTFGEGLLALRIDLGGVDLTDPARLQDWRCVAGDDDDEGHLRLWVRRWGWSRSSSSSTCIRGTDCRLSESVLDVTMFSVGRRRCCSPALKAVCSSR